MKLNRCLALAAVAGMASAAFAGPPSFMMTGQVANDLSADGNTVVGSHFDVSLGKVVVTTYTRGLGGLSTGVFTNEGVVRCSADGQSLSYSAYDLENVSGLGTGRLTPHLWTSALGEFNLGIAPWTFPCDAFTNTPQDISGNGRYIVGDGYTTKTCGPLRPFVYDTQTHAWTTLPVAAGARVAGAIAANFDGTVICGRDDADPAQQQFVSCAVVWVKNGASWTRTALDPLGGRATAVSADGNTVVGVMSSATMFATFGTYTTTPVRWTRSGSNWIPHDMGGDPTMIPVGVSADGSTVVGWGGDGSGFIWRSSVNGGVAMNLDEFVLAQGGNIPAGMAIASGIGAAVFGVSADGNAVLISMESDRDESLVWFPSAVLYLNGASCEPPSFTTQPVSHFNPAGPLDEPFGITINAFIAGSLDMNIQWQKETFPGSGEWTDLSADNAVEYLPDYFNYHGVHTMQLRLGALDNVWPGRYRCMLSGDCGSQASREFRVAGCLADMNCDQMVDLVDFFEFFNAFDQTMTEADLNDDGVVDLSDFFDFFNAFDASC